MMTAWNKHGEHEGVEIVHIDDGDEGWSAVGVVASTLPLMTLTYRISLDSGFATRSVDVEVHTPDESRAVM